MPASRTLTLGPDDAASQFHTEVPAFVLLWDRDLPGRAGEVALLPARIGGPAVTLGRADARPGDPVGRVVFERQRPGRSELTGPLQSPHVSREQLEVQRVSHDGVRIRRVGRCPLVVDGVPTDLADLRPGAIVQLQGQALLLYTMRPTVLPVSRLCDALAPPPFGRADAHGIVGESPVAWELRARIAFMAPRPAHVLVRGASGTGKELVARALHRLSERSRGPWVSRSAATLPESLADAELFGHAAGYPNAGMPERKGLVGEGDGGTLFLDEIGELPIPQQARLLRVLDEGEYTRLGEARPRKADLRLVGATNRPLEALKEDVAARFHLRLELPDLNARREDVPLLAAHLLRRMAAEDEALGRRVFPHGDPDGTPRIGVSLVDALVRRTWTTHVRELQALLWRSVLETQGDTLEAPSDLGPAPLDDAEPVGPGGVDPLAIPAEVVQACLDRHGGRQEPAWRELGLASRHVLTRLVKRHGLQVRGRSAGAPGEGSDV